MTPAEREQKLARLKEIQQLKELKKLEEAQRGQDSIEQIKDGALTALDTSGRALDYVGGTTRTPLYDAIGEAFGRPDLVTSEDYEKALVGKAPGTADILERAGVPNPLYLRDAAGLVGDIVVDPLTYATFGGSALVKGAERVGNPLAKKLLQMTGKGLKVAGDPTSKLLDAAGKARYKSAFKNVDKILERTGNAPISEVFLENGAPVGGMRKFINLSEDMVDAKAPARNVLYTEASENMVRIDPKEAFKGAQEEINKMRANPGLDEVADQLQAKLDKYIAAGPQYTDVASQWKTDFYDTLPGSAFDQYGKVKKPVQKFAKDSALGLKEEIIKQGNKARTGLGDEINVLNDEWGTLLAARKPMRKELEKSITKNPVTLVDAIIGGAGYVDPSAFAVLAAKKGVEVLNSTTGRTALGKGLMNAGKANIKGLKLADPITRRLIINAGPDEEETSAPRSQYEFYGN